MLLLKSLTISQTEKEYQISNQKHYKFLTLLYLKKKFFQKILRHYKQNQIEILHYTHCIIYFKLLKKNLFITFCNDLNKKLSSFSLGLFNVKKKLTRSSKQTFKFIFFKIKQFFKKERLTSMTIFFRGLFYKIKKFYKFFLKQKFYYNLNIYFRLNKPHGGCRSRKKRRC